MAAWYVYACPPPFPPCGLDAAEDATAVMSPMSPPYASVHARSVRKMCAEESIIYVVPSPSRRKRKNGVAMAASGTVEQWAR